MNMRSLAIFLLGAGIGISALFATSIASKTIGDAVVSSVGGKTQEEYAKGMEEAVALDSSALLDEAIWGSLSVDAASLVGLKASQVDCRRGLISTLEQVGFKVELANREIRFASMATDKGEIRGLASCSTYENDSVSDISLAVAVRGIPENSDVEAIKGRLSAIWSRR